MNWTLQGFKSYTGGALAIAAAVAGLYFHVMTPEQALGWIGTGLSVWGLRAKLGRNAEDIIAYVIAHSQANPNSATLPSPTQEISDRADEIARASVPAVGTSSAMATAGPSPVTKALALMLAVGALGFVGLTACNQSGDGAKPGAVVTQPFSPETVLHNQQRLIFACQAWAQVEDGTADWVDAKAAPALFVAAVLTASNRVVPMCRDHTLIDRLTTPTDLLFAVLQVQAGIGGLLVVPASSPSVPAGKPTAQFIVAQAVARLSDLLADYQAVANASTDPAVLRENWGLVNDQVVAADDKLHGAASAKP